MQGVNPPGGAAGANMPGAGGAGSEEMPPESSYTLPSMRGLCDPALDSGFDGDDACLKPPDPDKGFQHHVGPTDYTDQAQINTFIFQPGQESSQCYLKKLALDHPAHYMVYELSGRPGTHHIIWPRDGERAAAA
jgi:hypothetical protein